jgi:hypothetical protein
VLVDETNKQTTTTAAAAATTTKTTTTTRLIQRHLPRRITIDGIIIF